LTKVFLDTVGLIALWDETDQWHDPAHQAFLEMRASQAEGVTTDLVLIECGNAAARRTYRHELIHLRQRMLDRQKLFTPTDEEMADAWRAYDRGNAGDAGIVDHVSFIVMRRLGIQQAFTNDTHFQAAGFETLF
jgi:uncharacterized protein